MSPIIASLSRLSQLSQDIFKSTEFVTEALRIPKWKGACSAFVNALEKLQTAVDAAYEERGASVFGFFYSVEDIATLQKSLEVLALQTQKLSDGIADRLLSNGGDVESSVVGAVSCTSWKKIAIGLEVCTNVLLRNMGTKKRRRNMHLVHVGTAEAATAAAATRGVLYYCLFMVMAFSPLTSAKHASDAEWRRLKFKLVSKQLELAGRKGGFSGRGWDMYENRDIQETAMLLEDGSGWVASLKRRLRSAKRRLFSQFGFIKNYFSTQVVSWTIISAITWVLQTYGFSAVQLQQWAMGIAFLASLIMFNARWNDADPH
jgi:hypothetical protein